MTSTGKAQFHGIYLSMFNTRKTGIHDRAWCICAHYATTIITACDDSVVILMTYDVDIIQTKKTSTRCSVQDLTQYPPQRPGPFTFASHYNI